MSETEADNVEVYHIEYRVESHPSGIRKNDAQDGSGVCDSILQIVMAHDKENGRKHYAIASMDGERNDRLSLSEQWEAWMVLTRHLSHSMDPSDEHHGWQQQVCEGILEVVTAMQQDARRKVNTGLLDASGKAIVK